MNIKKTRLLFSIFCFLTLLGFGGNDTLLLTNDLTAVSAHSYTRYYHDETEIKSAQEVIHFPIDSFSYFNKSFLNKGYGTLTNWFIIDVKNDSLSRRKVYFSNEQVSVVGLEVYLFQKGKIIKKFTSQNVRKNMEYVQGKFFFFPIEIPRNETFQIVVKFRNPYGSVRPKFMIYSAEAFDRYITYSTSEVKYYYFFIGIYCVVLLMALITFILRKEMLYLYYFFFALFNLMGIVKRACLFLELYQFFDFLPFEPSAYSTIFLLISALLFFYEFNKPYIKLKIYHRLFKFLIWYIPIYFLVAQFIHYTNPLYIFQIKTIIFIYFLVAVLCVLFCIEGIRSKNKASAFLLLSLSVYFYFAMIATLFLAGILNNDTTQYSQEISVGFEITVITIVLISRLAKIFQDNNYLKDKLNYEQMNFIKKSIEIQNQERSRISKDLHDDIGQQLTGLKLMWFNLRKLHEDSSSSNKFSHILENTIENVRQLSHQMMPAHLLKAGLDKSLEGLCLSYSLEAHQITYDSFQLPEIYNEQLVLNIYRIVQEAISNALKHGKATVIQVNAHFIRNKLIVSISDNGYGFDIEKTAIGFGLTNLESRCLLIDASMSIESEIKIGTTITIKVNYKH